MAAQGHQHRAPRNEAESGLRAGVRADWELEIGPQSRSPRFGSQPCCGMALTVLESACRCVVSLAVWTSGSVSRLAHSGTFCLELGNPD